MSDASRTYLLLHGLDGSGPGHWQRWLEAELRGDGERVVFPDLPDEADPKPDEWVAVARAHLPDPEVGVVICHSLATLLWMHLCAVAAAPLAKRVLLVAPPHRPDIAPVARFLDHGADAAALDAAADSTLMICSDNDPYCPPGGVATYAKPLALECEVIPGGGHLNTEAGYGPWPRVAEWARGG